MNDIATVFLENPAASAFGAAGLLCQLTWPLFSRRRAMLGVQMGIGAGYGVQYALIGATCGAGICALGATQTLIALLSGDRAWLRYLGFAFLPVVAAVCFLNWSGASSLYAFSACSLIMLGRLQKDTLRLRTFMLAAAPFGVSYDILVGAAPALVGACVSAAISAGMLIREYRKRRAEPAKQLNLLRRRPHAFA